MNTEKIRRIKTYVNKRIHDVYGVGTYLTNDVGIEPLNIVIKMTFAKNNKNDKLKPVIKLSDDKEKYTGNSQEIEICKKILNI